MSDNSNHYCAVYLSLFYTGQLNVQITVSPPGVTKQSASSVNLTCAVVGTVSAPLSYQWTSTCTGNCFVLLGRTAMLSQPALHLVDSGNHTCTVTDAIGNSGTATAEIDVTGS